MKTKWIILLAFCLALFVSPFALAEDQNRGGSSDGYAMGTSQSNIVLSVGISLEAPYRGGSSDGYVMAVSRGHIVLSTGTGPSVNTFSPADGATEVAVDANLVITFSKNVDAETGNITIKKTDDDSTVETIDVTGGQVTGSGTNTITVNPGTNLQEGTGYYVLIDATAFDDAAGNSYPGISSKVTWNFTTVSPIIDVTAVSQIDKFGTRFNRRTGQFSMMATWKNIGADPISQPLQMVIENITPNTVTVANVDGTVDGKPFYDYSNLVGDGKLDAGETSQAKQLIFNNPNRARLEFDVVLLGKVEGVNAAPGVNPFGQPQPIHFVIPVISALAQNFPNPFNPETWIPFELAEAGQVQISIYDVQGKVVRNLNIGHREVGQYFNKADAVYWDGRNRLGEQVGSGVYFYHIQTGDFQSTRKMVILK